MQISITKCDVNDRRQFLEISKQHYLQGNLSSVNFRKQKAAKCGKQSCFRGASFSSG